MEICDFLKSWKRMCNSMTEMNGCEDCPIVRNTHGARCGDMPCEMQDVKSIAREVKKWAAEHPEPVYPTFAEWLAEKGVFGEFDDLERDFSEVEILCRMREMMFRPMPADIAEKLGIEPKE